MLGPQLIIARKEIRDHLRDTRSLVSALFYSLMGPLVVAMVSFAVPGPKGAAVLASMMSVFALVAAFVGGMNLAIDAIAGERERRSLLPLLMNPLRRSDLVLGKWIAIACFAIAGLGINLLAFAIVIKLTLVQLLTIALTLIPLALLAAALEMLISTWCRNLKEAHTYLSLISFVPMGLGMYLVFYPHATPAWLVLPVTGQELLVNEVTSTGRIPLLALAAVSLTVRARTLYFTRANRT